MVKDSDHPLEYFCQIFEESVSIKISHVKIWHYMVANPVVVLVSVCTCVHVGVS